MMEYLRGLNMVSMLVRVVLAILIGGIIGMERGRKNSQAGLRTYILVCLGATLVMMTNQFVYVVYNVSDPVRLGAQVISGIGFLGAGTIMMKGRSQIKGLTTAAGLWTAACLGLAIGVGFYEGAIIGSAAIMFTIAGLSGLDSWIHKHSRYIEVYIEYSEEEGSFSDYLEYMKDNCFDVVNMEASFDERDGQRKKGVLSYILTLKSTMDRSHVDMIKLLSRDKGVQYMREL